MKSPVLLVLMLLSTLAPAAVSAAAPDGGPAVKRAGTSARLLVPFFEVDMSNPFGASTFFSVRNEILQPVDVLITYYATDRPQSPLHFDPVTLPPKKLQPVDIRSIPNLLVDDDGLARGYVIIETVSGEAVIQGEYFQITPDESFATGSRLVDIDPQSADNDLCSVFTIRFLNGGGFDGGTVFTFWLDLDVAPQDTPVLSYEVYNEAGERRFFVANVPANQVAFRRPASELVSIIPTNFGAVEIQLVDGIQGHVSATMSALGRYSVGLEAVCRD